MRFGIVRPPSDDDNSNGDTSSNSDDENTNTKKKIVVVEPLGVEHYGEIGESAVGVLATTAPSTPYDPKAARIARRYDRSFMREVDARLFYYVKLKNLAPQKPQ